MENKVRAYQQEVMDKIREWQESNPKPIIIVRPTHCGKIGITNTKIQNMSTSLYWSKVPVEPKENNLYSLKFVLARKLWDADGSLSQDVIRVGKELIPFLEGIEAANSNGDMGLDARKLINAINSNGEVQLCIHS